MTEATNTSESITLGDRFEAEIENIDFDYKGRIPSPESNNNATREDLYSHFAEYFKRHFQAALDVLGNKEATLEDIQKVNHVMDNLAWADNYFLETYNEHNRRELERHITSILSTTNTTQRNVSSICLMLKMQIDAENKRIQDTQGQLKAAEKTTTILDGE